ncbi:glycosyltransferase family 2 protein [Zavarzinia sp. CC-PAN008]|uniref:glycosyltransferase family 2 protein n=1 Tax=Zavarzinia sp. CC-PAN008 TaxID=3243332 RepID=UPI003F74970B
MDAQPAGPPRLARQGGLAVRAALPARATPAARDGAAGLHGDDCIDVVVVSFRTGPTLDECLDAVLAQEALGRLILVDNGNPPAVAAALRQRADSDPRIDLVAGQGNVGFAAACNMGVARARADTIMLLNPDAVIDPGALGRLLALLRGGTGQPLLLGCILRNPDGTEQSGSRRKDLTLWTVAVEVLRLWRLAPGHPLLARFNQHEQPLPPGPQPVAVISGACMTMRTADFHAIGGMDPGYFLHFEDVDFCWRFRRAGGSVVFVPGIGVKHYRSTSAVSPGWIRRHKIQGMLRYFGKKLLGA